jgi:hypothetical protein
MGALKPPNHPTVINMPFVARSVYSDTYLGKSVPYDPEVEKIKVKYKRG